MGTFRPSNLNKREYPKNANVIGPTTQPTCVETCTTCCSCLCTTYGTECCVPTPGSSSSNKRRCECFDCCGCCLCRVCTRTIPGGMYTPREQYCSIQNDTWPSAPSSSNDAVQSFGEFPTGTYTNPAPAPSVPLGGNVILCCGGTTTTVGCAWVVGPSGTQTYDRFDQRCTAATQACQQVGFGDWFIPNIPNLANGSGQQGMGYARRGQWPGGYSSGWYWTNTGNWPVDAHAHNMGNNQNIRADGPIAGWQDGRQLPIRPFRCYQW